MAGKYKGMHGSICRMERSLITCPRDAEMKHGKKEWGISSAVQSNCSIPSNECMNVLKPIDNN